MARERAKTLLITSWSSLQEIVTSALQDVEDNRFDAGEIADLTVQGAILAKQIITFIRRATGQDLEDLKRLALQSELTFPED